MARLSLFVFPLEGIPPSSGTLATQAGGKVRPTLGFAVKRPASVPAESDVRDGCSLLLVPMPMM